MIVVHGETLWSPAPQPMDDDDDDDDEVALKPHAPHLLVVAVALKPHASLLLVVANPCIEHISLGILIHPCPLFMVIPAIGIQNF